MTTLSDVDVVILAGGKGERLRRAVPDLPKALAPLNGRPFVDLLVAQILDAGARRLILALGWGHEAIEAHVARARWRDLEVVCVVEPTPRGTGGALAGVAPHVRSGTVLVMNGDTLVRVDLLAFLDFHRARKARCSVVASKVRDASRYGQVEVDADGRVRRFVEKPPAGPEGYVNAGIYLADVDVLRKIPPERPISFEREILPALEGVYAMTGDYPFVDIGTPESLGSAAAFIEGRDP